jgi:hypothetical protein
MFEGRLRQYFQHVANGFSHRDDEKLPSALDRKLLAAKRHPATQEDNLH